jgi:hypothetical protein
LRASLVVDTLQPSTISPSNRSDGAFECAEELFLSSLTDFHSLRVCVIITYGWAWSLAWRQLGVESVPSLPLSQLSGLQLNELGGRLEGVLEVSQVSNQVEVISGHVTTWMSLWSKTLLKLLRRLNIKFVLSCSRSSSKDVLKALNQVSQLQFCFQELRHRRLGGLTSAHLMIIWGGVWNPKTVKLAARNMESRSLSRFLEPAVRNASQGTLKSTSCDFVWHPHKSTSPFFLALASRQVMGGKYYSFSSRLVDNSFFHPS